MGKVIILNSSSNIVRKYMTYQVVIVLVRKVKSNKIWKKGTGRENFKHSWLS